MATITNFPSPGRHEPESWGGPPRIVEEDSFDFRRVIGALLRRKFMIAGMMATGLGLSFVYTNQLTPLYSASVTVLIEGNRNNVLNIEKVAKGLTPDYYTNETQAAIIQSRDIAGKVVDRLELSRDPRFNPELAPPRASLWAVARETVSGWIGGWIENWFDSGTAATPGAGDKDPWAGYSPQEKRIAQREMLIDIFLSGLSVIPSQRALLVEIEYVSASPEIAAKAANAVAEVYILEQLADKGNVTQKASKWLAQRATELRQRLIDSEKRLEKFRRQSGIMEVQGVSLFREQAAKLNIDLVTARTRRGEAEARYRQVQNLLRTGGIETAAAVLDSPLIQRLREQESTVHRKFGEMKTQVRAAHPSMALVRNELADVRANIAAEVNRIVVNLGNELEIAKVREQGFAAELKRLESQIDTQNDSAVTLRTLQSEVHANKQLYETVISRFKETGVVGDDLQQADAKTISPAMVPGMPFYPQKSIMMAVALFFATAFGIALAIILEVLDNGFRTLEQIEEITGMPAIGMVPRLSRQDRARKPHEVVSKRPDSLIGESIRTIQTSLLLSGSREAPKVVLVTSSIPGEGKTSIALSLASLAARTGNRSIAIDCDLRRASLHQTLKVSNEVGLSNYLSGQAELEDIVQVDPASGLHYISAGARVPHPTDLLGSQRMYGLLQQLEAAYDSVILDTPPLLAVSDALVLVRAVDRVVFVVKWETTRRDSVIASVKQIAEAGAHIGGGWCCRRSICANRPSTATPPGPAITTATARNIFPDRRAGGLMSLAGTSTLGGRAGGLVLLAVGVALVAATVPNMAAHIAMGAGDRTMIALRRGAEPPPAALRSAIATRDAALGWRNFAQPLADQAALYFELASRGAEMPRDPSGVASAQYRNALLDRSITLHRTALGQGPARPYAWLRLAQAQYLRDMAAAKLDPLLRLSYRTAPAEPQLALQRIKLVFAARHLVGQGFDETVSRDIRLVVRYRPGILSEFARERFALPWLREKLRSDPDIEARFIGDYLKLPSP